MTLHRGIHRFFFEVAQDGYNKSAAATKAELKQLEADLQQADAKGDRKQALNILSRMLELQKRFMERWSFRSPGRSDSNPGNA